MKLTKEIDWHGTKEMRIERRSELLCDPELWKGKMIALEFPSRALVFPRDYEHIIIALYISQYLMTVSYTNILTKGQ